MFSRDADPGQPDDEQDLGENEVGQAELFFECRTAFLDAQPEETLRYMTDKIPMRRMGSVLEAAQMLAWMVSPACSFTTGFTFDLSGGRATY